MIFLNNISLKFIKRVYFSFIIVVVVVPYTKETNIIIELKKTRNNISSMAIHVMIAIDNVSCHVCQYSWWCCL